MNKYVGGQHFARVDGVIGGIGKKFFYHNDHQGTALAMTDEYGNKVVDRDFSPFGNRIAVKDNDTPGPNEDDSGLPGRIMTRILGYITIMRDGMTRRLDVLFPRIA